MSEPIPTEDLVAICLLAVDGDLSASLLDVVQQVERYQASSDRHFGQSQSDFRSGMFWLLNEYGYGIRHGFDSLLSMLPLRDWIFRMLYFEEFYCNDEGEHWAPRLRCLPALHPFEVFFSVNTRPAPDEVKGFLKAIEKDIGLLARYSREGESS